MHGTIFLLKKPNGRTEVPQLTITVAAQERIAALLMEQRVKSDTVSIVDTPAAPPWPGAGGADSPINAFSD
jgi:hypothetical protein